MPITKSAQKANRQAQARTERNKATISRVKTYIKKVVTTAKTDKSAAEKLLPMTYKVIDTAAKKKIFHKNTASRKKAFVAKAVKNSK